MTMLKYKYSLYLTSNAIDHLISNAQFMSITAPTTSEYNKFDLQRFLWVLEEKCQTVEKENAPDSLSLWLKRVHMSLLHLPAHLPFPPSLITLISPAIPLPVFSSYTTSPQYSRFRTSKTEEAFCLFLFGILSCFPKWTECCLGYKLRIWLWFGRFFGVSGSFRLQQVHDIGKVLTLMRSHSSYLLYHFDSNFDSWTQTQPLNNWINHHCTEQVEQLNCPKSIIFSLDAS